MSTNNIPASTGLTFEKVWQMFQETAEQMKDTDRRLKETEEIVKETNRGLQETKRMMQKTDKFIKDLGKQMGGLNKSFGELAEHLVAPGMIRIFNSLGHHFYEVSRNIEIKDGNDKILTELDLLLDNDETMIVIEVKSRPRDSDIPHHIRRLEIFREHITKHKKLDKKIIGAIAGAIFDNKTKEEAVAAGFYAITQSGDTLKLDVPADFQPRIF
ncbi:MAG: hypothetical protein LBT09_09900 [Planctomycetaceae bacterium]|jgi:hypothetical protein|nr:hypothetical protein [Planctomycetaceae bacterium]